MPYDTVVRDFESLEHVKNWVINNQLGRRNITPETRLYLIGKRYQVEKQPVGANQHTDKAGVAEVATPKKTATKIAESYKIGERTVRTAEKFAKAVDEIAENFGDDVKTKEPVRHSAKIISRACSAMFSRSTSLR